MKNPIIFLLLLLSVSAFAQDRSKFLYAEFADKSVTISPFYTAFGNHLDPAVTLGAGINYRNKKNRTFFQTLQLTGYSTLITGNGVTLTTSFGYRYGKPTGIFAEGMFGIGGSLFFPSRESFSQDADGTYVPVQPLHAVAALPIDILVGYDIGSVALYLKYRYMMIGPYAEALPVVPHSLIGIGIRYNAFKTD